MPSNPPTEDRTWKPIRPWVRRLELKDSVGLPPVVVGGVDPKDSLRSSQGSIATVATREAIRVLEAEPRDTTAILHVTC